MYRLLLAIAIVFCGCQRENPIADLQPNTQTGIVPPESEDVVVDSLTVSFKGTSINMFNTSGGKSIGLNKQVIFDIKWDVQAKAPDNGEVDLSNVEYRSYIFRHLGMEVYCGKTNTKHLFFNGFWSGAFVSGFEDGVYAMKSNGVQWDNGNGGFTASSNYEDQVHLVNCNSDDLIMKIVDRRSTSWKYNAETGTHDIPVYSGGTWKIEDGVFRLPDISFFVAPGVEIIYHPIVSDASEIEYESAWLNTVMEDRGGFGERIDRMLPLSAEWVYVTIGAPIVVSPDSVGCEKPTDGALYHAIRLLKQNHPNGTGFRNGRVHFRIGVMSPRMKDEYCNRGAAGIGYVGEQWSVYLYEKMHAYSPQRTTLEHEIGHNLGLPHTDDDPDYPTDPRFINNTGYLIRETHTSNNEVHIMDPDITISLMYRRSGLMLSEYNWNKILDFFKDRGLQGLRTKVAISHSDELWVCDHPHP